MTKPYVEDGLLIGRLGIPWAWYRLPTQRYEHLGYQDMVAAVYREVRRLTGLIGLDLHLLVVPRPFDVDRWRTAVGRRSPHLQPGGREYLDAQAEYLRGGEFHHREVFLGVRLGATRGRSGPRDLAWLLDYLGEATGWKPTLNRADRALGVADPRPDDRLIADLQNQRDEIFQRVRGSSQSGAGVASAEEIRWLVKRTQWRGISHLEPRYDPEGRHTHRPSWGGEWTALLEGIVHKGYRSVRVEQPGDGSAHVATLAVANIPRKGLTLPGGEWLYIYEDLDFPVEASVRLQVRPAREAASDVDKAIAVAMDQAQHIAESGSRVPIALEELLGEAEAVQNEIVRDRVPEVYAYPRLIVPAENERELQRRVKDIKERFQDIDVELVDATGDQLSLFLESMPGDRLRVPAYQHRFPVITMAGSLYSAGNRLGDGLGPYIGATVGRVPVFMDPILAAESNRPTTLAVLGAPGGGKSNLAYLIAAQCRFRDVWCVLADPKAEANGLAEWLRGFGQRVNIVTLNDDRTPGQLDPFRVEHADLGRAAQLSADMLRYFLPVDLARQLEPVLIAVSERVAQEPEPSLRKVVDRMADYEGTELAIDMLRSIQRWPLARTCFDPGVNGTNLHLEDSLTILQFTGLNLPDAEVKPEDYTVEDRLAAGLVHANAALASSLMWLEPRNQPKALFMDEVRIMTESRQGQKMIAQAALMGRSRNTIVCLVGQNAAHLGDESITNNMAGLFAFRSTNAEEIDAVLRLAGLESNDTNRELIATLGPDRDPDDPTPPPYSECLHRDLRGRVGILQVDLMLPELREAFSTTPDHLIELPPEDEAEPSLVVGRER